MLLPFTLPPKDDLFYLCVELFSKQFSSFNTDENKSEVKIIPSEQISKKISQRIREHPIFNIMQISEDSEIKITLGYGNRNSGSIFKQAEAEDDQNIVRVVINVGSMENYQLFFADEKMKFKGMVPNPNECKTMDTGSIMMLNGFDASEQCVRISKTRQQNYLINGRIQSKIRPRNYMRKTVIIDFRRENNDEQLADKVKDLKEIIDK